MERCTFYAFISFIAKVGHSLIASLVFLVRRVCLWICTIPAGYGRCLFLLHCWRAGGPSPAPHAGSSRPFAMLSYSGPGEVWEPPLGSLCPGAWPRNCDGAPGDASSGRRDTWRDTLLPCWSSVAPSAGLLPVPRASGVSCVWQGTEVLAPPPARGGQGRGLVHLSGVVSPAR